MNSAPQHRALALFDAALDLPASERAAFLAQACAGDDALRQRVNALLAADQNAAPLLDTPLGHLAAVLAPDASPAEQPGQFQGTRVGPYEIVRELGRGGMGTVYLAEREDVGKRVALKLVAGGVAAPDRIARFLFERRVLARLQHPHIATLLDAGLSDDGTPWFAMEYVEGQMLDRYADGQQLSVARRLALFEEVLEAVAYAHHNFVVHRDLKPSNILVTEAGQPRLLDFGIARLLEDEGVEELGGLTRTGGAPMTPDFAAPEQLLDQPITPATDVYQLGIVLYALLSGRRPYRLEGRSLGEIERRIVHETPPRPSVAVRKPPSPADSAPEAIAQHRSTTPDRLQRHLRGDLDAIVMKALAKEPERRYANAQALLDDLQRHRQGRPVLARPDAWSYRTRKFVARYPWRLGLAATILVLSIGFSAVYTLRVTAERDRATLEAQKAQEVSRFLVDLFAASNPFSPTAVRIDTMDVKAFMIDRAARIETLADQPEVQLEVVGAVADMFHSMGVYDQAQRFQEQALALTESLRARPHRDIADRMQRLGEYHRIVNDFDEAERLFRSSLAQYVQLGLADSLPASNTHNGLGEVLRQLGNLDEAETHYARALALRRTAYPDGDPALTQSMNNYALIHWRRGRLPEAQALFLEALAAYEAQLGTEHPRLAAVLHNLGLVHQDLGALPEAEAFLNRSLAIKRTTLGDIHWRVANAYSALGGLAHARGDLTEAERLYRASVRTQMQAVGEDRETYAPRLHLADVLRDQGRLSEAEAMYRQMLDGLTENTEADHPHQARVRLGYGTLLLEDRRHEEAERLVQRGFEIHRNRHGNNHRLTAQAASLLGAVYTAQGRLAEAEPLLIESLARLDSVCTRVGCSLPTLRRLVVLYDELGQNSKASPYTARLERASLR